MPRFFIQTFGCQMNKHDSEKIAGLLVQAGYEPHNDLHGADVIVFNTCSVRENAADRLYGQLGALVALKSERPDLLIAVGGCQAQADGEAVLQRAPHVDVVFGTHNFSELPRLVHEAGSQRRPMVRLKDKSNGLPTELPSVRQESTRAWLPVSVGCDNCCSYCIVPDVRGRETSVPAGRLLSEARRLVGDGVVEITLLGQNVNSYGSDLGQRHAFPELLRSMSGVGGLRRIRFATSHPKDLSDELIAAMAELEPVCEHLHLPVQAGSDRVLEKMNRRYKRDWYLERVAAARKAIPDLSITTDIIVGFPGETEEDFEQTLGLVREVKFDAAYTFLYSRRPGTPATELADAVPAAEMQGRFDRLVELQTATARQANERLVGQPAELLVESESKKDSSLLTGRTRGNKLVHFPGSSDLVGRFVDVRLVEARTWYLMGGRA